MGEIDGRCPDFRDRLQRPRNDKELPYAGSGPRIQVKWDITFPWNPKRGDFVQYSLNSGRNILGGITGVTSRRAAPC
jgi:hypothetical protein